MKGRGGAAVSDVFRYEEVPPSHQPSGGGHEAGSPLGRRPWSARRGHGLPRASATWLAPGCRPHRGAAPQLRFVVGRYAATAARYAAQVWRTRPKPFYETQQTGLGACPPREIPWAHQIKSTKQPWAYYVSAVGAVTHAHGRQNGSPTPSVHVATHKIRI